MEENNKVDNSEVQVIEEAPIEEVKETETVEETPTTHIEYINDLLGKDSKITAYSLFAIGIMALVAIIICLFIAF